MAIPATLLTIPGVQPLQLEVQNVEDLGPRMRRIVVSSPTLEEFTYRPGQDVMLVMGEQDGRPLSRRYTIRAHDPAAGTLELYIVAHGVDGPGARWAAAAKAGDRVEGVGPRGKIFLDDGAEWHLFFGDESAAAVSLAMLEAVPADIPARAYIEVTDEQDELPHSARHEVRWLHRATATTSANESGETLQQALETVELPPGKGHVYIAGEVRAVAALKQAALARGLAVEQISAKAYWGLGKPNASRGEPD